MRNLISNFTIVCMVTLGVGCKQPKQVVYPVTRTSNDDLAVILKSRGARAETFTLNATTGGTFTSSKGIKYTVDPGIFIKSNGETVQGDVAITVTEITEASDMILNDMPTNALIDPLDSLTLIDSLVVNPKDSSNAPVGAMLNSFGEFKVEAEQGGDDLSLKPNTEIEVEIPQPAVPEPIVPGTLMPVWSTIPTNQTQQNLKGYDYKNRAVNTSSTVNTTVQTGEQWVVTPQECTARPPINTNQTNSTLNFGVDKLGEWRNCDILITTSRTTTILGYFTNIFNDTDSVDSYNNQQANMFFFKKKGDNTLIKLYNHILNAPEGKKGLLSYQRSFGIGMEGTFLAIVKKEGKYYVQKKQVVIGEPANGKNFVGIEFVLNEVTEIQMFDIIESMNNE